MNDKDFLAQRVKDLEDSVAFFSSKNKPAAERWVAASFLENLHVDCLDNEIISPKEDPPDVIFRDARFEIKEILDVDRRRHDEYKAELKRARTLSDAKDLLQMVKPKDETLEEIYRRCAETAFALEGKYPVAIRSNMDLLFYVNLRDVFKVIEIPYPDTSRLVLSGWRSVSFVMGQRSCCFFARSDAPEFIRRAVGHISHLCHGRG